MDTFVRDLRFALRILRRRPLFTAVAVGTLGLGIGASTTVFSVVNGVLLWDPPYEEPNRLVAVAGTFPASQGGENAGPVEWREGYLSYPEYVRWRDNRTRFQDVAIYSGANLTLTGLGHPERIRAGVASASLFPALGVRLPLGRGILPGEDGPGARSVVVLSHGFWSERFGADSEVLGRTLILNGEPFEIVGVLPAGFRLRSFGAFSSGADSGDRPLWVPVGAERSRLGDRDRAYEGLARLGAGVSLEQARTETETLIRGDRTAGERGAVLVARRELETRGFRAPLLILLGASGVLLLIACGNVAALISAEYAMRRQELAVRTAMGAGSRRLARQLLSESLFLGVAGSGLGVVLAMVGTRALLRLAPPLPHLDQVGVSGPVLLFGVIMGMVTGVLFGLAPLKEISSRRLRGALTRGAGAGGGRTGYLESGILAFQMALTVILLVSGGLLTRSLVTLLSVEAGFEPSGLAVVRPQFSDATRPSLGDPLQLYEEIQSRVVALPGVESVGAVSSLPFLGFPEDAYFDVVGRASGEGGERPGADRRQVAPGYFETLGIPLLEGRTLQPADRADATPAMVISEAMAREYWPGSSALGQQVRFSEGVYTVVGVVGDLRHESLAGVRNPTFYIPFAQHPQGSLTLVARTSGDPAILLPAIREVVWEVDPGALIRDATSMSSLIARTTGGERFRTALLAAFGLCALLLAGAGVLGVAARKVARRTRELGLRMALGAQSGAVVWMVVRETLGLGTLGMAVGTVGALGVSRVLTSFLFGIEVWDPLTYGGALALLGGLSLLAAFYGGALALLGGLSLLAAFFPARRATRIEPVRALRFE